MLQWVSTQKKTSALPKGAVEKMAEFERLMVGMENVDL